MRKEKCKHIHFDRGNIHHKCYKQQQLSLGHIIIFSPLLELLKSSSWFTANQPEILLLLPLTQKGHEMEFAGTHNNWDAIAREKEPAIERKFLCGIRKRREGGKEEESWSSLFSLSLSLSLFFLAQSPPEPVFQRVSPCRTSETPAHQNLCFRGWGFRAYVVCTLSISYLLLFFFSFFFFFFFFQFCDVYEPWVDSLFLKF